MPQLGESLHPLYVRFFCDKFVASFVPRLIGNIYRCRRIGEVGAQQMQLDVGTLKQTLLDLPTLGQAKRDERVHEISRVRGAQGRAATKARADAGGAVGDDRRGDE